MGETTLRLVGLCFAVGTPLLSGCVGNGTPSNPSASNGVSSGDDDGGVLADAAVIDPPLPDVDLSCPNAPAVQAGAPWPMQSRCPAQNATTPAFGPRDPPSIQWSSAAAQWALSGPVSPPIVVASDGTIYAYSQDKGLVAVGQDGTVRFALGSRDNATTGAVALEIGHDGTVYVCEPERLYAVRPDGSVLWSLPVDTSALNQQVAVVGINFGIDDTIVVPDAPKSPAHGDILAVRSDGHVQWKLSLQDGEYVTGGPAVGPDGTIYFTVENASNQGLVVAADPSGSVLWRAGPMLTGGPIAIDASGNAYVSDTENVATYSRMGNLGWRTRVGAGTLAAVFADGTTYVNDASHLYMVRPNGTFAWRYDGIGISNPIVAGDGSIYVSIDGSGAAGQSAATQTLVAIDPTGNERWRVPGGGQPYAVGPSGTIYSLDPASGKLMVLGP